MNGTAQPFGERPDHGVSPCFVNCGEPACQKLGCIRVYNADHRHEDQCTGTTASWCPIHGDCTCEPDATTGEPTFNDPWCPLHAPESPHGAVAA